MKKFSRIHEFQSMNDKDISKVRGGICLPTSVPMLTYSTTACCTCQNDHCDNCTDVGQGSTCVEDPNPQ
jgi:hypothetical protein